MEPHGHLLPPIKTPAAVPALALRACTREPTGRSQGSAPLTCALPQDQLAKVNIFYQELNYRGG